MPQLSLIIMVNLIHALQIMFFLVIGREPKVICYMILPLTIYLCPDLLRFVNLAIPFLSPPIPTIHQEETEPLHSLSSTPEPTTFSQASKHICCLKAMQSDLQALENTNTWTIVDLPLTKLLSGVNGYIK